MYPFPLLQGKDRVVRRYSVPALSLVHLLLFLNFRRGGGWTGWVTPRGCTRLRPPRFLVVPGFLPSPRLPGGGLCRSGVRGVSFFPRRLLAG